MSVLAFLKSFSVVLTQGSSIIIQFVHDFRIPRYGIVIESRNYIEFLKTSQNLKDYSRTKTYLHVSGYMYHGLGKQNMQNFYSCTTQLTCSMKCILLFNVKSNKLEGPADVYVSEKMFDAIFA